MAAIITQEFRRRTAQLMLSEIRQEVNKIPYYVGIGKSDSWDKTENALYPVPVPTGSANEQREILSNLASLIKVFPKNAGLVIPNVKYKSGLYFKEYNPSDENCFYPDLLPGGFTHNPCYTINGNRIYLCLRAGTVGVSVSSDPPVSVGLGSPAEAKTDGYVWVLIDEIQSINDDIVNSDQFITTSRFEQKGTDQLILAASSANTGGLLYGFNIINGGKGYNAGISTPSTIQFKFYTEEEETRSVDCPIEYNNATGEITSVRLPANWDYSSENSRGIVNGYFNFDDPGFAEGSEAIIVANVSPRSGFMFNSAKILPTWYISVSVAAEDNIKGDGVFIPYRQISLIRDPEYDTTLFVTDAQSEFGSWPDTLGALSYIELTPLASPPADLLIGETFKFSNGTTVLYDGYDNIQGQKRMYFHQNDKTGYGLVPFGVATGQISYTKSGTSNTVAYQQVASNEYNIRTGEVIFTESRTKIERAKSQTEEIKIIIQF